MLKHIDSESNSTPAERVRVTPAELVAAVAELQAHKEGQSGTIAIGDAVHELSLDESPADILRTIEGQRAQQVQKRRKRRRSWIAATAAVILMLVPVGIALRPHHVHHVIQTPIVSAAPAETLFLSSVRDEQQVYVDSVGVGAIIVGLPASEVPVYANNEGIRWGLIKHQGKPYIQAYTLRKTEKALTTKPVVLVNSEDVVLVTSEGHDGAKLMGFYDHGTWHETMKVTLPVTAFIYEDLTETQQRARLTVSDVLPDSHLWDGFADRFTQ